MSIKNKNQDTSSWCQQSQGGSPELQYIYTQALVIKTIGDVWEDQYRYRINTLHKKHDCFVTSLYHLWSTRSTYGQNSHNSSTYHP